MKQCNVNHVFKTVLVLLGLFLSTGFVRAQLSGTKTIPTDYASIAAFVTDLNTQGVGAGGVTLNVPSGYTETAPAGGYAITASGTLANQIVVQGAPSPAPVITASAALVAGNLNDAIFKIVGGDYITIAGLDLRENAANTTTAAATNNMTEWGIALLYTSVTDNAQNITLTGNAITLNRTYQNTFGIYANATHAAATPTTSATGTGAFGGNSGLKIYSNTISNVNHGILVVGPTPAADANDGIDIGGSGVSTGNTITNYGTTGTFSGYANVSGSVNGIVIRNSKNFNISYNSVTSSAGGTTVGTLRGIFVQGSTNTPTGTFTNSVNNNTISVQSGNLTGTLEGISYASGSISATSTININNNNFVNASYSAAASGTVTLISQTSAALVFNGNNNTFTSLAVNTTGSLTFFAHSYSMPAAGTTNINGNAIVGTFSKTGAGGSVILTTTNGSSPNGTFSNYLNNNFSNITVTGGTTVTGFNNTDGASSSATKVITGNTFNNWTGGTNSITGMNITYINGVSSISNNTLTSITGQAAVTGISLGSSFNNANPWVISNNTISGLSSTGTGGAVTGISCGNTSPLVRITNNAINTLSSTGASLVTGISVTGATSTMVSANKVYGLSTSNAGGTVFGIQATSGTSVVIYNNVIGGLTAPVASSNDVIRGISVSSTASGAIGVYYNSVYLNASSSGTNFGTSGIFHAANASAGTAALDMRNNIIINESTPAGTGITVAFRRSGTALNNFASTSNRNMLFAGTPSATRLIMYDGTTSYQTMLSYQTAVVPREVNSFSGETFTYGTPGSFFISLTPSSTDFLKPVAGITTQAESGGVNITTPAITDDFAAVIRAGNAGYAGTGTAPDLGAFEFAGVTPTPVITLNSVTPPATTQCVATARLVSVNVNPSAGTTVAVNLAYTVNGVPQTAIPMTNTTGSTWEATIPAATPGNATIAWGVSATNSVGISGGYTGTPYSDEPLTGSTATAAASPAGPLCAGASTTLTASLLNIGTVVTGAGGSTSSSSSVSPFYHGYGGVKTQYIIRASELTAMGLTAGNISALSLNVSSLGTAGLGSFTIHMGHTAQNAAVANTAIVSGLSQVFSAAPLTLVSGTNTFTFSAPFNWNGTSNVVISFNYSNNNAGATSSAVTTDPALGFTSSLAIFADNTNATTCLLPAVSSGQACMGTSSNGTSSTRPMMMLTGNKAPAIQSVSWSDGVGTVGTTNPLSVAPVVTTTYTGTITAAGCTVAPSPTVTVTVNPLPSAPTATNSAQCGTQVPTASVTSTTGAPTPTFNWYDAAVAGTLAQPSGTAATFTSNVAATTTFYVSELNVATGCLSPRTPVTITVATADGVSANAAPTSFCIGSTVTLTAANTNPTPNQSYTYSWSGPAGSGAETPVAGASVTITPTVPGTYTYNLSAVDGGCNAVATTSATVNPFTATLAPVDATCNGVANGSFTQGASTCGTMPYTYSVDGGAFGAIPTNLAAGTHAVIVKDANNFQTSTITVTIGQPSTLITNPTVTNASVCQNSANALVSAATTVTPASGSIVVPFNVTGQPTETNAAPGNIVASATYSLPAGATVTGGTLVYNGLAAGGNSWMSDIRLGFSGAVVNAAAAGTGSTDAAGTFNYTRAIPAAAISAAGGTVNLLYWDFFNDNGGAEATFPTGATAATLTINYTVPLPASISWWDASTGGTQIGTGSPFETVGTSVLPNTNTPGVYTVYAQGQSGACPSPGRTAVTVTVKAKSTSSMTQTACNTYTLNGTTYNTSGTYTQTLTNAAGCDSTITLNLTIKLSTTSSMTQTACSSYTLNGTTYNASGVYTQTLTNAAGCDSTLTLNLTINQPTTATVNGTGCNAYTYNGTTYNTSGTYTQTLTNAAGCDSVVTINVVLNNSFGTITDTACSSYTFNGTTYTVSGSYMDTLVNMAGCDSIVTLNLTINQPTTSSMTQTACSSYTLNGTTYNASGVYTQTLTNAAGCDSTLTLNLTINQPTTASMTVTQCGSYTLNGTTYNASGVYTQTLTNAAGCDSTLTLNLTINAIPNAVATDNGDLTITASSGATYQWVHCATGLPIAGATTQTFTATVNGSYAVVVTNALGCFDTSNCVTVSTIGLDELSDASIRVFPNPTHNDVTVVMSSADATIDIVDAKGQLLATVKVANGEKVDLSAYETGIYFLRIRTDNGSAMERIVKN